MKLSLMLETGLLLLLPAWASAAPKVEIPPGDKAPLLRVEAGGPTSVVTALTFSPNGQTLYTGGWDKVVRVWARDARTGDWEERPAFRIPLGPGSGGKINALALSADGKWLAVAGLGVVRSLAGFREQGVVLPSLVMDERMRQDQGIIYVFNTGSRAVQVLRGHQGPVMSLAFAPPDRKEMGPPPLVSAARQWSDENNRHAGAVWLWDVAQGTYRPWPDKLPDPILIRRPGLAVWRASTRSGRLQVGVAWEDGDFRLWDVERGQAGTAAKADGRFNITLAALPDRGQILTGGFRGKKGYLQVWKTALGKEPQRGDTIPDGLDAQTGYLPLALTPISSRPGATPDHLAVVLRVQKGGKQETHLHLLDLNPRQLGKLRADILLWARDESIPTVAAVPGGRFLAVAGNEGHGIRIYSIKDLLAGAEPEPVQITSAGTTVRYVSFARGKKGPGLVLNGQAKKVPGTPPRPLAESDSIFDFGRPGLTGSDGWRVDAPELGAWEVKHHRERFVQKPEVHSFEIFRDERRVGRIALKPNQIVTDFALLPPTPPFRVPILAVAWHEFGEPVLMLFDARSGSAVRQYTGHDAIIRCLAFSADGRLLVSAAADQTICVWSLTDLDGTLGKRGLLSGLAVKGADGAVVGRVEKDSPAHGKLKEGDIIAGLVSPEGKLRVLSSARSYYRAIWQMKPGDPVRLQVKGKKVIRLIVGQGIDERKPLFTLFFTRGKRRQDQQWLGWNPLGPYEVSTPRAERHLGWHINTGRLDAPASFTSFARAAGFRDKYYRKGILSQLIAKGDLAAVAQNKPKELPPPKLTLLVGGVALDPGKADAAGRIPVQTSQATLLVAVHEYPREKIRSVEWQLDEGGWEKFEPAAGLEWSADLPRERWQRGQHTIHVRIHTSQGKVRAYPEKRFVRFQPPPPTLTTSLRTRQVVMAPRFVLEAVVRSALPGQSVEVNILQNQVRKKRLQAGQPSREVKETLMLSAEENVIEIVAVNRGALAGHEEQETARLSLEVVYKPVKPQLVLDQVVPLPPRSEPGPALAVRPGQPVRVSVPRIRIRGSVTATEELTVASRDGFTLGGFEAGKSKTLTFGERVRLKPGMNKVTFLVKTSNTTAQKVLQVDYRPPLPQIEHVRPEQDLVFIDEGKGAPEVVLHFQLTRRAPLPEGNKFTTAARVNGKKLPSRQVTLDSDTQKLSVRFTLTSRKSQVQVQLSNVWKEAANSELVEVLYLRPPRAVTFRNPPQRSEDPVIDLTARVHSPLALLPASVEATVNGRTATGTVLVKKAKDDTWLVHLKEVSLDEARNSKNVIRLKVSNEDGECRQAGECTVIFVGKPPKRPEVVILAPGNKSITNPELTIQFRIRSQAPLKRLVLMNGDTPVGQPLDVSGLPEKHPELKLSLRLVARNVSESIDVAKLPLDAEGFRNGDISLPLPAGINRLYVKAANEGGEQRSAAVVINYLPPPVRLVLDKLVPVKKGKALPAEVSADGKFLGAASQAHLRLHGRVIWDRAKDEELKAVEWVRVRINGAQQGPAVKLARADRGRRERAFRVEMLLTRAKDNRLEIDLSGLEQEDSSRRTYLLDCTAPAQVKRYLHLLIVGIGAKDQKKMTAPVFQALRGRAVLQGEFKLPGFDQGYLYNPQIGKVDPDRVYYQLMFIKSRIGLLAKAGPSSHVVMVYYRGTEVVTPQGHFFRTSTRAADPDLKTYRIPCGTLEKELADSLGAKILLLDVQRDFRDGLRSGREAENRDKVVNWPANSYVAVMRYAQLGKSASLDEARLIKAWEAALARVNKLKQVDDQVDRQSKKFKVLLEKNQMSLSYNRHIPRSLYDLAIGGQ